MCSVPWRDAQLREYHGGRRYLEYRLGVQYHGGYHEHCGGYPEYRGGIMMHMGGHHEYHGGENLLLFECPTVLKISPMVLMITPTVLDTPMVLCTLHGTEHTLYRVVMFSL